MFTTLSRIRRRLLAAAATVGLTATAVMAFPAPASAAPRTVYVSPSGTGTDCSSAQPCSLTAAQAAVRSLNDDMSDDIVVQLADGVYRLAQPLRLTAEDSGSGGHTVVWQAAPSARPVITGARAVTGWSVADAAKNIWRADVPAGLDARQLYVDGAVATRARTQVNRADFTASSAGMRFSNGALSYLNNLANQSRVEVESVNSFTDRYSPVQSISGNFITMQQPAWNNNNFGYDTLMRPHRAGPFYLSNAYEFLDSPGEWYLNPSDRSPVLHPPGRAEHEHRQRGTADAAVAGERRRHVRRAGAPRHVQRDHLHRYELAGPQQQPGLRRPADRRVHRRQLELAELRLLPQRLHAVRGRPADTGGRCRPPCRSPPPTPSPSATPGSSTWARRPSVSATTPTRTPAASAWAPATSR